MSATDRRCPTCKARPGEPCVSMNGAGMHPVGTVLIGTHPERRKNN